MDEFLVSLGGKNLYSVPKMYTAISSQTLKTTSVRSYQKTRI